MSVHVVFGNSRPTDFRVRVQLLGTGGEVVDEAFTNDRGRADFGALEPGLYVIRVDGVEIEDTQTGYIELLPRQHWMEQVTVRLRSSKLGAGPPGKPVSVLDLNVPKAARKEFQRGTRAAGEGKWQEARQYFQKAIELYPKYAQAYSNLGYVMLLTDQVAEARQACQKAIETNDRYAMAYNNLARVAMREHRMMEAQSLLEKSLSIDPNSTQTIMLLAQAQLYGGKLDAAITNARRLHALPHQQYSAVHLVAAVAFEEKKMPQDAIAEYGIFLQESPNDPDARRVRQTLGKLTKMNH
ncbi:MAG: tetratricopeptide repeat protein [Terriglobales bacterium]